MIVCENHALPCAGLDEFRAAYQARVELRSADSRGSCPHMINYTSLEHLYGSRPASRLSDSSVPVEFEGVRERGLPFFHAGDDVGAAEPVGLGQVGRRPLGGMVRMGMVEADDVFAALAAFTLDAHQFLGIDVVAVVGGVGAGVAAAGGRGDDAGSVVIDAAE